MPCGWRRPSEIICAPSCQTGAILGRAGIYCSHGSRKKPSPSLHFTSSVCPRGLLLPQPVLSLTYHVCILPQQFRPVCYQEQVPNWSMEFSRQASGTAAAKATVVGSGILSNHRSGKGRPGHPFGLSQPRYRLSLEERLPYAKHRQGLQTRLVPTGRLPRTRPIRAL